MIVKVTKNVQRQKTARSRRTQLSWCLSGFALRHKLKRCVHVFVSFKYGKREKFLILYGSKSIYCLLASITVHIRLELITTEITYKSKDAKVPFVNSSVPLVLELTTCKSSLCDQRRTCHVEFYTKEEYCL